MKWWKWYQLHDVSFSKLMVLPELLHPACFKAGNSCRWCQIQALPVDLPVAHLRQDFQKIPSRSPCLPDKCLRQLALPLRSTMELPHLPSTSFPYLRDREIPLSDGGKLVLTDGDSNRDRGSGLQSRNDRYCASKEFDPFLHADKPETSLPPCLFDVEPDA